MVLLLIFNLIVEAFVGFLMIFYPASVLRISGDVAYVMSRNMGIISWVVASFSLIFLSVKYSHELCFAGIFSMLIFHMAMALSQLVNAQMGYIIYMIPLIHSVVALSFMLYFYRSFFRRRR